MHNVLGLGFRRVAKELTSQGFKISKDKAHRLYHKYKAYEGVEVEDEELREMKTEEMEARGRLELAREKEEIRKRIEALIVEETMTSYEKRKELFTKEDELLEFVEKVMPVVAPQVWSDFKEFCEEQGFDLANALATALGPQRYFEEQLADYEEQRLDQYLSEQIEESLTAWKKDEEEESPEPGDNEPDIIVEEYEIIYI